MYGIYAFCRVVDDIADEAGTLAEKRIALDDWRTRIAALFTGATSDPITRTLAPAVAAYGLVQQDFLDIIDGMEMDAGDPIVAPDLATLDLYCDRVAAAVGRRVLALEVADTFVGLAGTAAGAVLGLVLSANLESLVHGLERLLGTHFLDAKVYFMSDLPAHVRRKGVADDESVTGEDADHVPSLPGYDGPWPGPDASLSSSPPAHL